MLEILLQFGLLAILTYLFFANNSEAKDFGSPFYPAKVPFGHLLVFFFKLQVLFLFGNSVIV